MTKEEFDKLPEVFYIPRINNGEDLDYGPFKCKKFAEHFKVCMNDFWYEYGYIGNCWFDNYESAKQEVIRLLTIQRDKWQKRIDRLKMETILE